MITIQDVIAYKHPKVVRRFQKEFPEHAENAEMIFEDLMRFFWASEKHYKDQKSQPENDEFNFLFIMDEEMKPIDQMWHIFLLYTEDYIDYCQKYFGEFIHHRPDIVDDMEQDTEVFEENLSKFLSYTYDILGEDVVRRWFAA